MKPQILNIFKLQKYQDLKMNYDLSSTDGSFFCTRIYTEAFLLLFNFWLDKVYFLPSMTYLLKWRLCTEESYLSQTVWDLPYNLPPSPFPIPAYQSKITEVKNSI